MLSKQAFVEKLILRIDRLNKDDIKKHLSALSADIRKYHDLLQLIPVGVFEIFKDGKISLLNTYAEELCSLHNTETTKINLSEIPNESLVKHIEGMIRQPENHFQMLKTLDPRERILELKKTNIENSDSFFVLVTDVTPSEKKNEYEERLKLNQSILNLAGGVAHEIGNPLNALQIHLGLLREDLRKNKMDGVLKINERVDTMQAEIARLDQIVKGFLKTARKPTLKFKNENLVKIVEDALHFFQPEFEERKIAIKTEFNPKEISFLMDRERIYETLVNLIKNGIEAIDQDGEISISIKQQNKIVSLRIKDSGVGINEDDLEHIFDAYYTTKATGTGLGLVSVYHCVAEHGGRIEVKTKKNFGTTFTLMLPVREPNKMLPKL